MIILLEILHDEDEAVFLSLVERFITLDAAEASCNPFHLVTDLFQPHRDEPIRDQFLFGDIKDGCDFWVCEAGLDEAKDKEHKPVYVLVPMHDVVHVTGFLTLDGILDH